MPLRKINIENTIHLQSKEGRLKAINRFCNITGAMASCFVAMLIYTGLYWQAVIMLITAAAFFSCSVLNNKSYYSLSKTLIIVSTNFAVLYFSTLLGFRVGVHLYLYTAPLIAYLLYDFTEKKKIVLTFSLYFLNYLLIFFIHRFTLFTPVQLSENIGDVFYILNFSFSLILCFTLIFYFAFNNNVYTKMVIEANHSLKEKQGELQNEVFEKNILLSEIHHRVKNNLAVISGLVELQNFYVKDEKASSVLTESRNRIKSIALLHEKFYDSKNFEKIEICSYINELIYFIKLSFSTQNKEIKIHTEVDNIELSLEDALPFSLLLNELITNSYKHAFNAKNAGNIYISLTKMPNNLIFTFRDDGCGFDFYSDIKEKTLGLNLIEAFSKQLKGVLNFTSEKGKGTKLNLQF